MTFTLEAFFFDIPLYTKNEINVDNFPEFQRLIHRYARRDVDGYNPISKSQTTFSIERNLSFDNGNYEEDGGFGQVIIKCRRYGHQLRFYCYYNSETKMLMKIGQYPSVADLHIHEVKNYNKLMPKEKMKEFTRAIGLAANGVGIGSFVYLRRIFEYLINDAYQNCLNLGIVTEDQFKGSRMDDKIELLKSELPSFLVENKGMYSILSLGIHELDENTCLLNFDTLRVGIEIILDEKLEELRKKEKIEEAKKRIMDLKASVKKNRQN